ncbi:MAG: 7TM diverse intracellular signaling domain-containing protein [Rudaea sp.]|uniref:sensor histidine kinase n=1 Tax=Rudaea sp. TaxID=2136325 RepID=UPI0039E654E1
MPETIFKADGGPRTQTRRGCIVASRGGGSVFGRTLLRLLAFIALPVIAPAVPAQTPASPVRIEAARSDWNAQAPPDADWVAVERLPDNWSLRWPRFDGVVWYRLTWNQPAPLDDTALFVEYLTFAGEIRVNGALLERDSHLLEPLSRMWNVPRYWRLPPPLLHEGENTLLVRVSGFSQYQPGLGPVQIGNAEALRERFDGARWLRQYLGFIGMAIGATVGLFFLALWLLRRRETAYGWYAANQLAWFPIAWNMVTTSPWPFTTTDAFQNLTEIAVPLSSGCWAMFVLRFCGRRWPRRELAVWIALLAVSLWILLAPHEAKKTARDLANLVSTLVVGSADVLFLWFAWRGGRNDQRILSLFAAAAFGAGVHDTLGVAGVIGDTTNYATLTEHLTVLGVAAVLAWNFVRNLRRIEGFNVELQRGVAEARAELAATLSRQHELELVHARLGERVSLAHDLHDGLGGMLIGNIAELEQAPEQISSRKMLDALRELRDDLRLIIDTASAQHYGEHSLAELLAPLRHRMARLFEARDIDARWRVAELEKVYLTTTQSLDLLRILQEALANVLKHSGAKRVDVELHNGDGELRLEVGDNGRGMPFAGQVAGTGMRSMQARARRLGATLSIGSEPGATLVRLTMPLPGKAARP